MTTHSARTVEACARAAHEANRAYCIAIGDNSQVAWEDAEEWQRSSARAGVVHALNGATPGVLHEQWCAEKKREGWIYGPMKDPARKQHPCLVPYGELSSEQQAKDRIFGAVVRAMGAALGAKIRVLRGGVEGE